MAVNPRATSKKHEEKPRAAQASPETSGCNRRPETSPGPTGGALVWGSRAWGLMFFVEGLFGCKAFWVWDLAVLFSPGVLG